MRFKKGDRVRIRKDTRYYGEDPFWNPKDTEGTVTEVGGYYLIIVKWPGIGWNEYDPQDLELAEEVVYEI